MQRLSTRSQRERIAFRSSCLLDTTRRVPLLKEEDFTAHKARGVFAPRGLNCAPTSRARKVKAMTPTRSKTPSKGKTRKAVLFISPAILLAAVALGHDRMARWALEAFSMRALGLGVRMDACDLKLKTKTLELRDVTVLAPEGFGGEPMMTAPFIIAALDNISLLGKRIHLKFLDLRASEIVIVKRRDGEINVREAGKSLNRPGASDSSQGRAKKSWKLKIGRADVNIERVVFKDYSRDADVPRTSVVSLSQLRASFENVQTEDIVSAMELLAATSQTVSTPLSKVQNAGKRIRDSAKHAGKELKNLSENMFRKFGSTDEAEPK